MPEHYPTFPHHSDIKAYLDDYADTFGLLDDIEFGNGVVNARRAAGGGWDIIDQHGAHAPLRPAGRRQRAPLGSATARLSGHIRRRVDPLPSLRRSSDAAAADRQADPRRRSRQQRRRHHRRIVVEGTAEHRHVVDAVERLDRAEVHRRQAGRQASRTTPYLPLSWQRKAAAALRADDGSRSANYGLPAPNHRLFEAHPTQSVELPLRLGSGDVIPEAECVAARR